MDTPDVPASLRELAPPSECALLDWLRHTISRLMIEEISQNDCGEETLEHFAGVEGQLKADPPLGLLAWNPREVLELERWSEPDRQHGDQPPSGQHGHVKRLLACTILLRNAAQVHGAKHLSDEEFFVETSAATLIQLTRSAIALGGDAPYLAARFLLFVYSSQSHPAFRPFAACGVLLLTAHFATERLSSVNFSEVCSWVLAVEAQCRVMLGSRVESARWLIGLNGYEDRKGSRGRWADSAKSILERLQKTCPSDTQELLRELSNRLAYG